MREPAPARVLAAPVYWAGLVEVAVALEAGELLVMTMGAGVVAFVVVVVMFIFAVVLQAETVTVTVTALWAEATAATAATMAAVQNFILAVCVGGED